MTKESIQHLFSDWENLSALKMQPSQLQMELLTSVLQSGQLIVSAQMHVRTEFSKKTPELVGMLWLRRCGLSPKTTRVTRSSCSSTGSLTRTCVSSSLPTPTLPKYSKANVGCKKVILSNATTQAHSLCARPHTSYPSWLFSGQICWSQRQGLCLLRCKVWRTTCSTSVCSSKPD